MRFFFRCIGEIARTFAIWMNTSIRPALFMVRASASALKYRHLYHELFERCQLHRVLITQLAVQAPHQVIGVSRLRRWPGTWLIFRSVSGSFVFVLLITKP